MPTRSRFQLKPALPLLLLLLVSLVALSFTSGTGQAAGATRQHAAKSGRYSSASQFTCGTWSVVTSPNLGSNNNTLYGVAALSSSNVWAVGAYINSSNVVQTLIEQWNGTSWNVVTSPNVGSAGNELYSVAGVSPSNIWAVGDYFNTSSHANKTLIEHWNGTSWSVVTSPNASVKANSLHSVAVVSASNIWAAGTYFNSSIGANQTLIEHWNGRSWNIVTSPNIGSSNNTLHGAAALSTGNVWAVGDYSASSTSPPQTLIEQWNGTSWSVVTSPNASSKANSLLGVAALSANNVWAVGEYFNSNTGTDQTLIEQWNGTSWSVVTSPNVGSNDNVLHSVAAVSTSNVWAAGHYINSSAISQTLIEQWNGTSWSVVASPNAGSSNNILRGVAALSTGNVWAVGDYFNSSAVPQTLIEFYC